MIGKLTGFIDTIYEDYTILNVNDVGYKVFCSSKTLNKIQDKKDKISLLIETVVKEDSITLFGFSTEDEQNCFNILCKVSGVGNKVAQKIMSVAEVNEIFFAIANENKDVFCKASGVGPKVALRIIHELKNNSLIKNFSNIKNIEIENNSIDITTNNTDIVKDAIMALEGLGYQKHTIQQIVIKLVNGNPHLTLESVITESLKKINNF
ncbi:MAG: Holliday junction branch migration protein RuvA [Rickettsiales bacterium]|nr:Holliday junction branch migration protein RuvA [Rickettsiales bacterium]